MKKKGLSFFAIQNVFWCVHTLDWHNDPHGTWTDISHCCTACMFLWWKKSGRFWWICVADLGTAPLPMHGLVTQPSWMPTARIELRSLHWKASALPADLTQHLKLPLKNMALENLVWDMMKGIYVGSFFSFYTQVVTK